LFALLAMPDFDDTIRCVAKPSIVLEGVDEFHGCTIVDGSGMLCYFKGLRVHAGLCDESQICVSMGMMEE
jgi:hypothetical protein